VTPGVYNLPNRGLIINPYDSFAPERRAINVLVLEISLND
jgi:hypothetical protein